MAEFISVSAIKDSLTECPICTEQFDETRRIPRRMPCCVQSICHPCLETYTRGRQTLSCPMCRHQHHLPGGVKSLPKEPLILKILDHLKIQKGLRLPCTDCPDNHTAMAQCDNCGIFLCTECLNAHVRNRVTKNHKTLTFEEMQGRPVESFRRLHQCMEHQQPEQFYCHTCQKVICVSCTVVEHDKVKGHNVVSLGEAHQDRTTVIDETLTKLENKFTNLTKSVKELKEKKKNIATSKQRAKTDINERFDDLLEELQQRRAILLSEVDKKSEDALKLIKEALESTTILLTRVKSSTEYTRKMRSKADKIEDLQLMASSADSLNIILEETTQDVPFVKTGVCFTPAYVDQLISMIKVSGLVRKITYSNVPRPSYRPETGLYNSINLEPVVFPEVPCHDLKILGDGEIACPHLELDINTASPGITITEAVVTNTTQPTQPDTGCRIEAKGRVLVARPLVIKEGQRVMFHMKVNFSVKAAMEENKMIFETALTNSPVDANCSQLTGLSVTVGTCHNHKQQLCLDVFYDAKRIADVPLFLDKVGVPRDMHLGFILDGNTNKIHVINVDEVKVACSVCNVMFDKPLWIMIYIDHSSNSDMTGELISGSNVNVSQKMKQLLSSCY